MIIRRKEARKLQPPEVLKRRAGHHIIYPKPLYTSHRFGVQEAMWQDDTVLM